MSGTTGARGGGGAMIGMDQVVGSAGKCGGVAMGGNRAGGAAMGGVQRAPVLG